MAISKFVDVEHINKMLSQNVFKQNQIYDYSVTKLCYDYAQTLAALGLD